MFRALPNPGFWKYALEKQKLYIELISQYCQVYLCNITFHYDKYPKLSRKTYNICRAILFWGPFSSSVVTTKRFGKVLHQQNLKDVDGMSFWQKHDHTGQRVLILWTNKFSQTYFQDQAGFSYLVERVLIEKDLNGVSTLDLLLGSEEFAWKAETEPLNFR